MKSLEPFTLDLGRCRTELEAFRGLLAGGGPLGERQHMLSFFRENRHLAALIGFQIPRLTDPDRLAFELPLYGNYVCDLVVGDSSNQRDCFVEFEDAGPKSVFVKRAALDWSDRLNRGFSQIIGWFMLLDEQAGMARYRELFGVNTIFFNGLLVIGRDNHLDDRQRERLSWRSEKVHVAGRNVFCMTFDELCETFAQRLRVLGRSGSNPNP